MLFRSIRMYRPRPLCIRRGLLGHGGRRAGLGIVAVHDVSGGGLAQALVEMAAASESGLVSNVALSAADLITETPGRFVLATRDIAALQQRADRAGVPILILGQAGASRVSVGTALVVDVSDVVQRRSSALENSLQAAK